MLSPVEHWLILQEGLLVHAPAAEQSMVPLAAEAVYPVAQVTLNE